MSAKAETHMGHQHSAEPITTTDRLMSRRHKSHRAEVDMIRDPKKKLKQSIKYNLAHAKEHMKALKDNQKQLKKLAR